VEEIKDPAVMEEVGKMRTRAENLQENLIRELDRAQGI
jgi:hypothetical protein